MLGGVTGLPCSGGYKYGDVALQEGEVSYEKVNFGCGPCAIPTSEEFNSKLQTRPLVREGASYKKEKQLSDK
jgi:hypothetical protein